MEFLKKLSASLLLCIATIAHSQTQKQLQDAFNKSYSFEAEKKYSEAISQLAAVYSESSYEINLRLAWLQYQKADYAKSVTYYKICVNLMPVATEPLWGIIKSYAAQNDYVRVEAAYKSIIKLDPKNSTANYWLGVIFYNRKDYTTAKKYFEVSLNLNPFDYDILLMNAWTNYFLGNFSEAKILFNKTLLNHPNDKSALEGLNLIK